MAVAAAAPGVINEGHWDDVVLVEGRWDCSEPVGVEVGLVDGMVLADGMGVMDGLVVVDGMGVMDGLVVVDGMELRQSPPQPSGR